LLENLGCPAASIRILPAGLQTVDFTLTNKEPSNGPLKLLFVGRLIPLKGPDRFIRICRILKQRGFQDFHATLTGEGDMMGHLTELVQEFNIQGNITFTGKKTHAEIISLMQESDIFIFPGIRYNNLAETQGLVVQEAQAMKLPVIISDAGGMHEGIVDGVTGFVLHEDDLASFAERIEFLASHPEVRKKMGEAGRKFVEQNYDSSVLGKRLEAIYSGAA